MSRYTFSFRNMTFGENSNLNIPSRHYSSKSSGSNHLNHANLVDIPQIQIPPIIESNQNSQENPNLPSQHQINSSGSQLYPYEENIQELLPSCQEHIINDTMQHKFEPQAHFGTQMYQGQMIYEDQYPVNNDIFEVPPEYQNNTIYDDYDQYQNFQSQPQLFFQPNFQYQTVEQDNLLYPQNQYQYQIEDVQPNTQDIINDLHYPTQSSPQSQNQITSENLHSNLQHKSRYKNIIDGLKPHNNYQTIIDAPQSEPQYDDNDFLNMEELLPNKIDRLINRINEQILKQNELNDWFKNSVDKQVRLTEQVIISNNEQKEMIKNQIKMMEEQKILNEKIFKWMEHIEKKN